MAALSYASRPDRRFAALALTALVHALLLFAWQATRRLPPLDANRDTPRIQWIILPPHAPAPEREHTPERAHAPVSAPARAPARAPNAAPPAPAATPSSPAPAITVFPATPAPSGPAATAPAAGPAPAPRPGGPSLVERATREAGAVDRALRKENHPYIVAPADSPQLRMRREMEAAHAAVPNAWYQAPKIDELVNNTGDGARRTRVNGSYCVTDRAPSSSIDTIETLGKQRFTNCPAHEAPAGPQEWKTARDP